MHLLLAADSFKDALPAREVCAAIARGAAQAFPEAVIREFPLADGGEGLTDILAFHLDAESVSLTVHDPLHRLITASYLLSRDGQTAFVEMAQAAGLELLEVRERNPLRTSTFGVGEMIADALNRGARHILLGLGGSATNDAGIGMAAALGYEFRDEAGTLLKPCGEALAQVAHISKSKVHPLIKKCRFSGLCDVNNPLYGPLGAAFVYALQKGASAEMQEVLDQGLRNISPLLDQIRRPVAEVSAPSYSIHQIPGSGAAGGTGAGVLAFLRGILRPGIDVVMEITDFEDAVKKASLILSGEGRLDAQTFHGKLLSGITRIAAKHQVPVIALCGSIDADPQQIQALGLRAAFAIGRQPQSLEEAIRHTAENLTFTSSQVLRLWKSENPDHS